MYRKQYSSREFKKLLKNNGWYSTGRWDGDHEIFSDGVHTIPIALNLNRMIQFRLIKEFGLVEGRKRDVKALRACNE